MFSLKLLTSDYSSCWKWWPQTSKHISWHDNSCDTHWSSLSMITQTTFWISTYKPQRLCIVSINFLLNVYPEIKIIHIHTVRTWVSNLLIICSLKMIHQATQNFLQCVLVHCPAESTCNSSLLQFILERRLQKYCSHATLNRVIKDH